MVHVGFRLGEQREEACASMDSAASPASLTEEDYAIMDRDADALLVSDETLSWYGERSYSDVVRPRKEEGLSAFTNPWKGSQSSGRASAGVAQSGGGAPAVVLPKAPVKTDASVIITSKRPIVRDLGAGFVVQPVIAPPNNNPVWLEVLREKAAVIFLNLRSKTSEISNSWTAELELSKKTDSGETLMILSSVSVLLHSDLEVGFVVLDFEADIMTPESLRNSCVRASIVKKTFEDKASLMCITPGASFRSMSVIRLIDNYFL